MWFSLGFQFLTLCWFATLAAAVAALWEVGVMEADVLLVANKRYVQKEDTKHFLKVLQHTAIFNHPSILSGLGAVVTAAVVSAAAWWAADRKYLAIAAAACCVAFFLPVVLELFFGFDVVTFGIEAVRVHAFCEKDMLVGCFQLLVVCFSGIEVNCEFESEQHCSAAAASECVFALEHDWLGIASPVALPRVLGSRRQDGWTSLARLMVSSSRRLQQHH